MTITAEVITYLLSRPILGTLIRPQGTLLAYHIHNLDGFALHRVDGPEATPAQQWVGVVWRGEDAAIDHGVGQLPVMS